MYLTRCPRCKQTVKITPSVQRHVERLNVYKCPHGCGQVIPVKPEKEPVLVKEPEPIPVNLYTSSKKLKNAIRHRGSKKEKAK